MRCKMDRRIEPQRLIINFKIIVNHNAHARIPVILQTVLKKFHITGHN